MRAVLDTSTEVEQEVAGADQRLEHTAMILRRQRAVHELDAVVVGFGPARILSGHDGDAVCRSAYVTQDQRQDSLSDAAETDEYDPAGEFHMHFVAAHNLAPIFSLPRRCW
jgi:hypothetical protein